ANVALDQARQMLSSLQLQNPNVSSDNPVPAFVLESGKSNGQYIARPVVLGLTDDTEYVVLAGLSPGETIIAGVQTGGSGGVRPITPGGAGG
ncbi:MAG TPA: hypothetical protein VFQ30_00485, partial [Ktedonobacteraceae bacterium]|nr:hypothetical protein [Ktedonobacteraceae bacterium]